MGSGLRFVELVYPSSMPLSNKDRIRINPVTYNINALKIKS